VLVFAGLSPSADIYGPLWRIWGIVLGTLVVTVVFFTLWPEYAGDSLLPRLRKVIRDTLALAPGGSLPRRPGLRRRTPKRCVFLPRCLRSQMTPNSKDARAWSIMVRLCRLPARCGGSLTGSPISRWGAFSPRRLGSMMVPGRRARRCRLRYARGSNRGWSSLRPVPSFNAARAAPARDSRNEAIPALDEFSRRLEEQSFARISARSSNAARYSPSCSPCAGSRF